MAAPIPNLDLGNLATVAFPLLRLGDEPSKLAPVDPLTLLLEVRMRIASFVGSGILLGLLASSALAADPTIETPAPEFSWSGAYIGAAVGYAWGDHEQDRIDDGTGVLIDSFDYDSDGVVGGIYAGYGWQWSSIYAGIEADIEAASIEGGYEFVAGPGDTEGSSTEINVQGSLRARLGFAVDRLLVYGTAGLAIANVEQSFTNGAPGIDEETIDDTETGWTAGFGIDAALTDHIVGRLEYRYTDFGNSNADTGAVSFPASNFDTESIFHTVRLGVAYKF